MYDKVKHYASAIAEAEANPKEWKELSRMVTTVLEKGIYSLRHTESKPAAIPSLPRTEDTRRVVVEEIRKLIESKDITTVRDVLDCFLGLVMSKVAEFKLNRRSYLEIANAEATVGTKQGGGHERPFGGPRQDQKKRKGDSARPQRTQCSNCGRYHEGVCRDPSRQDAGAAGHTLGQKLNAAQQSSSSSSKGKGGPQGASSGPRAAAKGPGKAPSHYGPLASLPKASDDQGRANLKAILLRPEFADALRNLTVYEGMDEEQKKVVKRAKQKLKKRDARG